MENLKNVWLYLINLYATLRNTQSPYIIIIIFVKGCY